MLKTILNLFIVFMSAPAFACPELAGYFDCVSESGPVNSFIITKGSEGGQVTYEINGSKLIANGLPIKRSVGDGFPTIYTTTCEGQTLRARMQTNVSSQFCPSLPLDVDSITLFTLKDGGNIEMDDRTILNCPDKAPTNIRVVYTCKRK